LSIRAVICDFGGVLTSPLVGSFMAVQDRTGVPMEDLGRAIAAIEAREGKNPLYELEMGRITEDSFLAALGSALAKELGHDPELHNFREIYFEALNPNPEMIAAMAGARQSGMRMAMLTNNVREWEPLWRSMLPVDEIFELVVDSAFVGMRKPDPAIYELTLERLRALDDSIANVEPEDCLFIDDFKVNCDAASELGINAVRFESNEQALPAIRSALDAS
jgi:putative hydrolase of the HAD superfamily